MEGWMDCIYHQSGNVFDSIFDLVKIAIV
jgi:hypothetical protein